jgi:PAS domain S-box-containing protein
MDFQYTPYIIPPLMGGLGACLMAVYAWTRNTRTAKLFALFSAAGVVWAWGYALSVAGADLPTKLFWAQAQQVGVVMAPAAWAAFAFQYTGREKWLTVRAGVLALLLPAVTLAMVAGNDTFGLMWREVALDSSGPFLGLRLVPGVWSMVQVAYAYALYLVGSFIVLLATVRAPQLYRQQSRLLLLGMFLPWAGSVVDLMGLTRPPTWQVAPIAFAFSALVVAWGVLRYQLLDLVPVARDALVDASGDGLIVLDARNRVVDINPAARQILRHSDDRAVGQPADRVITFRPDLFGPDSVAKTERAEVALGPEGQRRDYDLVVSLLSDARGQVTGRLIALRDITDHKRIEGELRAQRQLFADLVAVARATSGGPTLQATLQNVLNVAATLTGAERGSLFLLNPAEEVTHSLLTYGGMTPDEQQVIVRRVMDRGLAGWVVRNRQAVLIRDTAHDERWLASSTADAHPAGSALGVPILSGGALAGVLTLTHAQPLRFTDEHLNLMQAAADQMALALRNAQIFEAQREMAQRQAMLYGMLRAVGEQLSPAGVARAAVEAIGQLVGGQTAWPAVSLALPDRDHQGWVNLAARGRLTGTIGRHLPMTNGIIGRAFRTGQPQYAPEVARDSDYVEGDPSIHSELAVPMRRGERVLGVLNLESELPNAYTPEDVLLAESLADAVALALDNANLYQTIAEESSRLQALIKSSRDGLFMVSKARRLLVVNSAALRLLGLRGEPEDWLGWPVSEILPPLRRQAPAVVRAMLGEFRRLQRGDEPVAEGEVELPPRTLHWVSLPVAAGDGPLGRLLVLRDVTEERLVQKLREELTDTLVHDLRNPLTNIRMALDVLDQVTAGGATPQQTDVQRVARSSTQRMLTLVNAILDVSRLESGQMPLNREPLALAPLAQTVIDLQQPLAQEKSLSLTSRVLADLPPVSADPALIQRVLENLVGNAVKFTPEHGCVQLSAAAAPGDGEVVVTVRDNGPGLSPETRGTVFQKFMTGRHSERGSGLGLAFCKLAVEAHGGRIWVESEPGHGAAFCFSLPLANGDDDEWDVME